MTKINEERLLNILLAPHVSEKASMGVEKRNEHVFEVVGTANKLEIKMAVEHAFNTKVSQVRILNVKPKARRFGRTNGFKKGWKKAYVTLSEGMQIDLAGFSKS